MIQSLAVKYRPKTFDEVLGQTSTIRILKRQLETNNISNCYLFAGPSGDGKTTIARILSKMINKNSGEPIEIDGASNNGVDAVRAIIDAAKERSIESEYKVFIIDECHALSSAAWQAFLKCIEEPPEYTIFMFCTTNPEKIPETILNRVIRFNLSKIDTNLIRDRLLFISKEEGYTNYFEACDYIAKLSCGGVRDAIAYLEKCANYSNDLTIQNVLDCLGDFSYNSFFDLTGALYNKDQQYVLDQVESYYNSGKDLKIFIDRYLEFMLDLTKYCLFKNMNSVTIPLSLEERCVAYSNIPNILNYSNAMVQNILNIKNTIKYDTTIRFTIEAMLLKLSGDNNYII